jgi:Fe2+ or Zn2+ uptake regulation protein
MARPVDSTQSALCHLASQEDSASFEEVALSVLRSCGHRITKPRIQVIRTLAQSHRAQSAYAIHEQIVSKGEKVDVVSVYRILSALQDLGLVHRVGIVDGFIPCRIDGEHGGRIQHLVCKECGCVTELSLPDSSFGEAVACSEREGFQAEDVRVEVLGTCKHCRSNSAS